MAPGRRRPHRPAQPVGQTVAAGAAEDEGGRAWRGALDPRLPPLASIPLPTHPPTHPPARPPTPHRRRRCGRMPRTRTQTHAWGGSTRQSSPRCSSRRPRDVSARRRPPGDCLRGRGGAAGGLRLTAGGGGGGGAGLRPRPSHASTQRLRAGAGAMAPRAPSLPARLPPLLPSMQPPMARRRSGWQRSQGRQSPRLWHPRWDQRRSRRLACRATRWRTSGSARVSACPCGRLHV